MVPSALVTVCIPIYKRLSCLSHALQAVEAQDYPDIELIVSDNGQNGSAVQEIIGRHYHRPCRFRQNSATVPMCQHYNQLIQAASGKYLILLDDDDSMSENFVSELVRILEGRADIVVAMGRQEVVDVTGKVLRSSSATVPNVMTGEEFIRSWTSYNYECYTTMLLRTDTVRLCGGIPEFPNGTHTDDGLITKLCLTGAVGFSTRCVFRWCCDSGSFGWSLPIEKLAEDINAFLKFLESDPVIQSYAARHAEQWPALKSQLSHMSWHTYLERWAGLYRERLTFWRWVRAGFAMPYIPEYYRRMRSPLWCESRKALFECAKQLLPVLKRSR